jgi:hypothetical protein
VNSRESSTALNAKDGDKLAVKLEGVTGKLLEEGKVVCTFQAPRGSFDRASETLQLNGGVTVKSSQARQAQTGPVNLTLTARQIVWTRSENLIEAEGGVWLRGDQFESGPAAKLVTTPDLNRFGTPDRFKS